MTEYVYDNYGHRLSIAQARKKFNVSKIIQRLGTWAVTPYGVECLTTYYPIEAYRLWQGEGVHPWERHLSGKTWVNMDDVSAVLPAARAHHIALRPKKPEAV